jgi:hypothetical protein
MELLIVLGVLAAAIGAWAIYDDKKRQENEMIEFLIKDTFDKLDELAVKEKAKKKAAPKKKAAAKKKAAPKKKVAKKTAKKKTVAKKKAKVRK